MCLEKRRGGPFIGYNKEENPTSNRCGIHIFQKSNTFHVGHELSMQNHPHHDFNFLGHFQLPCFPKDD